MHSLPFVEKLLIRRIIEESLNDLYPDAFDSMYWGRSEGEFVTAYHRECPEDSTVVKTVTRTLFPVLKRVHEHSVSTFVGVPDDVNPWPGPTADEFYTYLKEHPNDLTLHKNNTITVPAEISMVAPTNSEISKMCVDISRDCNYILIEHTLRLKHFQDKHYLVNLLIGKDTRNCNSTFESFIYDTQRVLFVSGCAVEIKTASELYTVSMIASFLLAGNWGKHDLESVCDQEVMNRIFPAQMKTAIDHGSDGAPPPAWAWGWRGPTEGISFVATTMFPVCSEQAITVIDYNTELLNSEHEEAGHVPQYLFGYQLAHVVCKRELDLMHGYTVATPKSHYLVGELLWWIRGHLPRRLGNALCLPLYRHAEKLYTYGTRGWNKYFAQYL